MAATSARTLRLLSLLQNHRYWPGDELAGRLEVSVRTLRRDIDRLRELGYPVLASRGTHGGYQLEAGAAMPPLLLEDDEAVSLAVALQTAAASSVTGLAESSVRALAKLAQVMPRGLRRRVDALLTATDVPTWSGAVVPDSGSLLTVAMCCRDSERIRFGYAAASGDTTQRHAEPLRLVSLYRRWYLVAYDLDRQDWRSYRLDRMTAPRPTGSPFRPRQLPGGDAVTFVREGIARATSTREVVAVVEAPASAVRESIGRWATVDAMDDGRSRVTLQVESLEWAAMALGCAGADFFVQAQPEFADLLREWGSRFDRAAAP